MINLDLQAEACVIQPQDLDSLPQSKSLQKVHIPVYGDIGLIVKPLAISLCYSDAKILDFGIRNPRVQRGFEEHGWIIPGHEVLYEVVESIGLTGYHSRDIIHLHPSAIFQKKQYLLGFTEPGGLCTRNFIGERFLNSDTGGNVLRLSDIQYSSNLAVIEPWSCIEADFSESRNFGNGQIISSGFSFNNDPENNQPVDVLLRLNSKSNGIGAAFTHTLPEHSSLIIDPDASNSPIMIDLHDIHYHNLLVSSLHNYEMWQESGGWKLSEHYFGHVVLFGGAGPMGQMYIRRLIMADRVPEKITIVDRIKSRLDQTSKLINSWSQSKSVSINMIHIPSHITNGAEVSFVSENLITPPDAIVVFCTDRRVVENCIRIVNDSGIVNVFAGMPPGNSIDMPAKDIRRNIVLFGRSGSSIKESKLVVERIKKGGLRLEDFVAKTVTLDDVWTSLLEVKQRKVDGKVLVLPSRL